MSSKIRDIQISYNKIDTCSKQKDRLKIIVSTSHISKQIQVGIRKHIRVMKRSRAQKMKSSVKRIHAAYSQFSKCKYNYLQEDRQRQKHGSKCKSTDMI